MTISDQQFKALHVGCEHLATALNDAGSGMKAVFAVKNVEVPWSKEMVKECLVKPIANAMYGYTSTKDIKRSEVDMIWEVLLKNLTENGLCQYVEFPSNEEGDNAS